MARAPAKRPLRQNVAQRLGEEQGDRRDARIIVGDAVVRQVMEADAQPGPVVEAPGEVLAGGEDDDVIFGRIANLAMHPDGCLYVLDNQLCHVSVFSPDGERIAISSPIFGAGA